MWRSHWYPSPGPRRIHPASKHSFGARPRGATNAAGATYFHDPKTLRGPAPHANSNASNQTPRPRKARRNVQKMEPYWNHERVQRRQNPRDLQGFCTIGAIGSHCAPVGAFRRMASGLQSRDAPCGGAAPDARDTCSGEAAPATAFAHALASGSR